MRAIRTSVALFLLVLSPIASGQESAAPAQEGAEPGAMMMPAPAKELAKLQMMIGEFEGDGVATAEPGAAPMEWTARSSVRKSMGGHWIIEETRIEFGGGAMPPLYFRSYTGWDRERKHFVSYSVSNMGAVSRTRLRALPNNRFLVAGVHTEEGKTVVEQTLVEYGKKGYEFISKRGVDGAALADHVKGSFRRIDKAKVQIAEAAFPMPSPNPQLAKLKGMVGSYSMKGSMVPMPGMSEVPIAGSQDISLVFGGQVLWFEAKGAPISGFSYEGFAAMAWDKNRNCYRMIYVNNMGESGISDAMYEDQSRQLAVFATAPMMGRLASHRSVMQLAKDGTIQNSLDEIMLGKEKTYVPFKATYTRSR